LDDAVAEWFCRPAFRTLTDAQSMLPQTQALVSFTDVQKTYDGESLVVRDHPVPARPPR